MPANNPPEDRQKKWKPSARVGTFYPEDKVWLAYVRGLSPEDEAGAFLLPDELPAGRPTAHAILSAIQTATRRAFSAGRPLHITDFCLGRIWGEMRVLMPQGRDAVFFFDGELGWKAAVIQGEEPNTHVVTAYYRYACMNPVRTAAAIGAELDSSQVTFLPLGETETQEIVDTPLYIRMFDESRARLAYEYRLLQRDGLLFNSLDRHPAGLSSSPSVPGWRRNLRDWIAASEAADTGAILLEWLRGLIFPEDKDH